MNLYKEPFLTVIKKFGLSTNTVDFIGHAVALYTNDQFVKRQAMEVIKKCLLYMNSAGAYGDSPFIYPIYGLAGIPEGFARKCALAGGTFMLNTKVDKFHFGEDGKVTGVQCGENIIKTGMVVCSPNYIIGAGMTGKVKSLGRIIRCICIMDHPIPNTKDVPSCQIILPQR